MNQELKDFRQLRVWKKSRYLILALYNVTATFPREELYGLSNQIRSACVSIPAKLMEGCASSSDTEMACNFKTAVDYSNKLASHLRLAKNLGFLNSSRYVLLAKEINELKNMLTSLMQNLKINS
ncbi:MAG: four helix bundle protein [bacterium]